MRGRNAPFLLNRFQPIPGSSPAKPQPIAHANTFHADALERHAHPNSLAQSNSDAGRNRNTCSNREPEPNPLGLPGRIVHLLRDAVSNSLALPNAAALITLLRSVRTIRAF